MTDEDYLSLAYGDMFPEPEADPWAGLTAAFTVALRRTFPTYAETLTVCGYPSIRQIIVTVPSIKRTAVDRGMPGVIRELPVSPRDLRTAETFRTAVEKIVSSYEREGWKRT